jgi:2-dehydro-3-deoxyphosphooctonate aldolase (KDO 8-P synthase)
LEKSIEIFSELNKKFYTTTDIHLPEQAKKLMDCIDIIQIPAFLSRQTDLLVAAAETGKIVNIKKFQLLSGKDMARPIEKVLSTGNDKITLTERGTLIPYGNMVVDLKNIVDMVNLNYPVIMDCTHACQELTPGQSKTSGRKEMASIYAQAAKICGVKGYFSEIYPNPSLAKSDSSTSLDYDEFENLIKNI